MSWRFQQLNGKRLVCSAQELEDLSMKVSKPGGRQAVGGKVTGGQLLKDRIKAAISKVLQWLKACVHR